MPKTTAWVSFDADPYFSSCAGVLGQLLAGVRIDEEEEGQVTY